MWSPACARATRGAPGVPLLGGGRAGLRSAEQPAWLPGGAQHGQQVAIEAVIAGHLPGEDQADAGREHDRVARCGTGEQEGHVHEGPEEGRDAGERAKDEPKADGDLAEDDEGCKPALSAVGDEDVEKLAIPLERYGRARRGLGDGRRTLPVREE